MVKLTSIAATNLKAAKSFRYDLGPVNVVTGKNYANKTAVLQAIQLALLGYVPGLPKTNQGIFSLASGAVLEIEARLSDGTVLTRSFVESKGAIKASHIVPASFKVPDVLMDTATYLQLSERERIKFVFSLINLDDKWTGEAILKLIAETPFDADKELIEPAVLSKRKILEALSDSDMQRHDVNGDVQTWLETSLNELRERVKVTNAALGRMEKYTQASVELRAGSMDAANVDRLLREKRTALQEASSALAVARSKADQAKRNEQTRKELNYRLSEPYDAAAIETTRKQIAELEATKVERADMGDLAFKVAEARGALEAAKQALKTALADLETIQRQHEKDLKASRCPHCGTSGKKFKDAIEKSYTAQIKELEAARLKADKEILSAKAAHVEIGQTYESAAIADKKAERDRLLAQSLKSELTRLETLSLNRAMWQKQLDGLGPTETVEIGPLLESSINALTAEVNELGDQQKRWIASAHEQKRQAEARTQRQNLEAELIALKSIVKSVETIQAQMVKEAFGKILKDVNRFCEGILLSPIDYHQGELGRWSGTVWIPHRSFSGTEQLISCAGISAALARQSPVRIVLLDELGRLTAENKRRLVETLVSLTGQGFIDQTVCVDVESEPYRQLAGVNLVAVLNLLDANL